jgi:hypothetical protein
MYSLADVEARLQDAFVQAFTAAHKLASTSYISMTATHPKVIGEFCTALRRAVPPTTRAPWTDIITVLVQTCNWTSLGKLTPSALSTIRSRPLVLDDGNWAPDINKVLDAARIASEQGTAVAVDIPVGLSQLSAELPRLQEFINVGMVINNEADKVINQLLASLGELNP